MHHQIARMLFAVRVCSRRSQRLASRLFRRRGETPRAQREQPAAAAVARRRRRPGHRATASSSRSRCRSRSASSAPSRPTPTVAVHAQITGELTSVNFKEGDDVRKGQVLFTLDRRPLEAALQQAQANLAARHGAGGQRASRSAQRYQDLLQRGIATREQVDTSRQPRRRSTRRSPPTERRSRTRRCSCSTRRSPRRSAGRTGALMVHDGNLVRANDTTPLVVINQVAPIYVSFAIPEAQLPDLKRYMAEGHAARRGAAAERRRRRVGRPHHVHRQRRRSDDRHDQDQGDVPERRSPALAGPVRQRRRRRSRPIHTRSSCRPRPCRAGQQGQYVFVVKAGPDRRRCGPSTSSARAATETVIKNGLKPGETVVTDGQLRLVAGSHVSIKGR